ncbi:MAG TPA: PrgI family protein, partial [Patescibacteria group bacterium]|nr:PrgI family protein [Patescibacteria group bacterium]
MADQFVIPQFLDVESKIIGPITVRQFVTIMVAGLIIVIQNRLFDFSLFLVFAIPTAAITLVITFVKIHGQPFHYIMLNYLQTLRRPSIRVWSKNRSDAEIKAMINRKEPPPPPLPYRKPPLSGSHLRDLSLVVNTGGVYMPDEAE